MKNDFLKMLFDDDDQVCSGSTYDTQVGIHVPGPFISINALTDRRLDSNVTKHRTFLVEMDEGTHEDQIRAVKGVNMPYSTVVDSGGKSLHFCIVLTEPIDPITWRSWSKALVHLVPGADRSTTNPSRFTRLPGIVRPNTGRLQQLLYVGNRINTDTFRQFIEPHIHKAPTDYRAMHARTIRSRSLMSAHPLTKAFLKGEHPCHQGRNNALYKCAMDLKNLGWNPDEIENLLKEPAVSTGLPLREIDATLGSVFRR